MQTVCESSTGTTLPKVLGLEVLHNELTQCLVGGKGVRNASQSEGQESWGRTSDRIASFRSSSNVFLYSRFVFGNFAFPFFKAALPL